MFYYLADLSRDLNALNVFRYITFRAGGAFLTALIFGFLFGRPLIDMLRIRQAAASRSAVTAPKAISSPRPAPRRWAAC